MSLHPLRGIHSHAGPLQHVYQPHPPTIAIHLSRHVDLGSHLNLDWLGQGLWWHGCHPFPAWFRRSRFPARSAPDSQQVVHPS